MLTTSLADSAAGLPGEDKARNAAPGGAHDLPRAARKIPEVVAVFWVMKICATTLGETAGDLLSMTMHVGYALSSLILIGFFLVTVVMQLASRRYSPPLYWAVILSTSTAGTTMSDYMDRTLGIGYAMGSLILVAILAAIFCIWRYSEQSLSVDRVATRRSELFYWSAILFSNTLGTALGDFLADDSGLGFAGGTVLIGGLLGVVLLATFLTRISRVLLFWVAFVLTRPFGATMGDVLTKSHEAGGMNLGTVGSSLVLAVILIALVARDVWRNRRASPRLAVEDAVQQKSIRKLLGQTAVGSVSKAGVPRS